MSWRPKDQERRRLKQSATWLQKARRDLNTAADRASAGGVLIAVGGVNKRINEILRELDKLVPLRRRKA